MEWQLESSVAGVECLMDWMTVERTYIHTGRRHPQIGVSDALDDTAIAKAARWGALWPDQIGSLEALLDIFIYLHRLA